VTRVEHSFLSTLAVEDRSTDIQTQFSSWASRLPASSGLNETLKEASVRSSRVTHSPITHESVLILMVYVRAPKN
jgi:hypothetical protein